MPLSHSIKHPSKNNKTHLQLLYDILSSRPVYAKGVYVKELTMPRTVRREGRNPHSGVFIPGTDADALTVVRTDFWVQVYIYALVSACAELCSLDFWRHHEGCVWSFEAALCCVISEAATLTSLVAIPFFNNAFLSRQCDFIVSLVKGFLNSPKQIRRDLFRTYLFVCILAPHGLPVAVIKGRLEFR